MKTLIYVFLRRLKCANRVSKFKLLFQNSHNTISKMIKLNQLFFFIFFLQAVSYLLKL